MINLFDLSTGMPGTNLLTERAHRDVSPVRRNRQDAKRNKDSAVVHSDDRSATNDIRSSSKKSNGTPMKTLLAKEMSKETTEPRKKPTSVVAKLMGLDDMYLPPSPQPTQPTNNKRESRDEFEFSRSNKIQKSIRSKKTESNDQRMVEYKDVYEVQERNYDSTRDRRLDLVRRKFTEAKRMASDERLLQSREFQDALEVLSSNKDLFLKFLEEPNSIFSIPSPAQQTKRITVLKPVKSMENCYSTSKGGKQIRKNSNKKNQLSEPSKNHHRWADGYSHPTRIVVLKPSPGKSEERGEPYGGFGSEAGPAQLTWESRHRRDESLLSSICSNGYGGDESSLNRSENGSIEQDEGEIERESGGFSDSEIASPNSRNSWDFLTKYGSPCSNYSSFSRASFSPESSVIREAKKRLSERWAMVATDEISQIPVQIPRSSSTLGEMLAINEKLRKEGEIRTQASCLSIDRASSNCNNGETGEGSPVSLTRSKSVPVSSSVFENIGLNNQKYNSSDIGKATTNNKGRSFFKGKVSSFFFSKSKKTDKEKIECKVESSSGEKSCNNGDNSELKSRIEGEYENSMPVTSVESSLKQGYFSEKGSLSIEKPTSSNYSNYSSENLDKFKSFEFARSTRDEPSPTSVFDAPFDDLNYNEPEPSQQPPLSRATAIESVARSLSWDETHSHSESQSSKNYSSFNNNSLISNNEEKERFTFVCKLLSSSGFDEENKNHTIFATWHSLESPLDPLLLDKFLDPKEEAAKCRERRSNQRLLFDCVNLALLEIGQTCLNNSYPWSISNSNLKLDESSKVGGVWSLVRDWFANGERFVQEERENVGLVVETVVRRGVEGRQWRESMKLEMEEMSREIGGFVLDELVGEALLEFAVCWL